MSVAQDCFYAMLGISEMAEEEEIQEAFEASKRRFEASKAAFEVLGDARKRGAYDRQRARKNEMEMKLKIEKLEDELEFEKKKSKEGSDEFSELEKLTMKFSELGGAGHYFGNDKATGFGGERDVIGEEELKKVLRLLAAGEKKINLKEREFRAFLSEEKRRETQKKFWDSENWNVAEAGWTIQFQTVEESRGGAGKYFHLWLERKDGRAKFKATAQQIHYQTGEEANRLELQSETDGTREVVKYEWKDIWGYVYVRFNITFL